MRNIETERLLLTPWTMSEEDIEGLYAYACDPDVGPERGLETACRQGRVSKNHQRAVYPARGLGYPREADRQDHGQHRLRA